MDMTFLAYGHWYPCAVFIVLKVVVCGGCVWASLVGWCRFRSETHPQRLWFGSAAILLSVLVVVVMVLPCVCCSVSGTWTARVSFGHAVCFGAGMFRLLLCFRN